MAKPLTPQTPVADLFMVGKTYAQRLKKLNIQTAKDLLYHFPHRYLDFRLITPIAQVQPGETVTVQGKVLSCQNIYTSRGKRIQKAVVSDASGQIQVTWFNQPFLPKTLKPGLSVSLSGKVDLFGHQRVLVSPEYEVIKPDSRPLHTGRLVPVYPETYGVSSKWLRSRIAPLVEKLVPQLKDFLPPSIRRKHQLLDLATALRQIHFPQDPIQARQARHRLAFDELFFTQLAALERKKAWQKKKTTHPLTVNQDQVLKFIASFPFKLTNAQKKAVKEILADLSRTTPMNRLLEGDVGSGKTVVAAVAIFVAFQNGFQSALMAPTEILAHQHYQTLKTLLEPFGVKIALVTSSQKKLPEPHPDLYIGTHALIYDKVQPQKLALVIIDEQHRFGVAQRSRLIQKGRSPHLLTLTATPIPRTVALTLYGDLDLSILDEMPQGRKPIKTWVVPPEKRAAAYQWVEKQITQQRVQAFLVCPLIEQSEKESMKDIKAATAEFERLKNQFPQLKLALLHGRLKAKEKQQVLTAFRDQKIDILVSTPVVEVGIDIPNATIMIIEAADRFGLAQLHQLRGRVGRRGQQAYCLLFSESRNAQTLKRLKALTTVHSGPALAEIDLKLRGPGELYGLKQHGFVKFKLASFSDTQLVKATRQAAEEALKNLSRYPQLQTALKDYKLSLVSPN